MYRDIIDAKVIDTIGQYTIVRVDCQYFYNNGTKANKTTSYDVCLDGGDGDIVFSSEQYLQSYQWALDDTIQDCMNVDVANIPENGFESKDEVTQYYYEITDDELNRIYNEYFGAD